MPNQAATLRQQLADAGAIGIARRSKRAIVGVMPGGKFGGFYTLGPIHWAESWDTPEGKASRWHEIDTDLEAASEPGFIARGKSTPFHLLIGNSANRRITPRKDHPDEYLEIGRPEWDQGSGWQDIPWDSWSYDSDTFSVTGTGYSAGIVVWPDRILTTITWDTQGWPFRFELNPVGLTYVDGTFVSDSDGETVLWLGVSRWTDAEGQTGEFDGTWDGQYLAYNPDLSGATFPVTIDPDFLITAGSNDAYAIVSSAFYPDGTSIVMGYSGGNVYNTVIAYDTGMPDNGVATAIEANVKFWRSTGGSDVRTDIYGITGSAPAMPTDYSEFAALRGTNYTTATVANDFNGTLSTMTTPDLSTIVQELADQSTWDGTLILYIDHLDSAGDNMSARSYEYGTAWAPVLYLVWGIDGYPYVRDYYMGLATEVSGTTYQVYAPENIEADDLILVLMGADGSDTHTATGSFTTLFSENGSGGQTGSAHWMKAAGTEGGGTLSVCTSTDSSEVCYYIILVLGNADVDGTPLTYGGTSTGSGNPNPGSFSAGSSGNPRLYLDTAMWDSNSVVTAYPSSYVYHNLSINGSANGDAGVACAGAYSTNAIAPSPNDIFTLDAGEQYNAQIIAVWPLSGEPSVLPPSHNLLGVGE